MERVDFYLVINIISFFLCDSEELSSQPKILDEIFKDFIDEMRPSGYGFDQSQASRIFSGEIPVSSDIRDFYQKEENLSKLAWRIENHIFASMRFHHMVMSELRRHMCWDDERKLEPPVQKPPARCQPEPQKKQPKRDYER